MEKLISFAFVLLVILANFALSKATIPQVKCVGTQIDYSNPELNQEVVLYITKKNDTYNSINLYWNLVKDFSADSTLTSKVYATDETFQGGELILANTSPICQPCETRELLPKPFAIEKSLLGKSCVKKGVKMLKDIGQFRFEVMVPRIQDKGKYFRSDYLIHQGKTLRFVVSSYNELSE